MTRFSFCGRQLEIEDGAQGRKHIDLLGGSYAEETYKARKAWTPTPYHCKIPWINFIPYILQGYKQLVQVYLVGKSKSIEPCNLERCSNRVGFGQLAYENNVLLILVFTQLQKLLHRSFLPTSIDTRATHM